MRCQKNAIRFDLKVWLKIVLYAILCIAFGWLVMIVLVLLGMQLPEMQKDNFFTLGFFAASTFGLIVFLTVTPLQAAANSLSPSFLTRMYCDVKTHLALYILLVSALISFFSVPLRNYPLFEKYSDELFFAIAVVCTISIIVHRFWVMRLLHQPWIVYQHVKEVDWETGAQKLWNELYECAYKAIKQGRLSDANYFLEVMGLFYEGYQETEYLTFLRTDVLKLYAVAGELNPCLRFMERKWPFIIENKS
ncbi:MAG: hypothetical protein JHC93_04335 [Parachlamydiales bacterium]|nr:hypothetical protein [Parachlamydiales bacterium]